MYTGMYQIQQLEQKSLYHSRVFSTPAADNQLTSAAPASQLVGRFAVSLWRRASPKRSRRLPPSTAVYLHAGATGTDPYSPFLHMLSPYYWIRWLHPHIPPRLCDAKPDVVVDVKEL